MTAAENQEKKDVHREKQDWTWGAEDRFCELHYQIETIS